MLGDVQKTLCLLTVLATCSMPIQAESINVRIISTQVPVACTPMLSGGGSVDYGAIKPNTLSTDAYTVLTEKQLDFAITCNAPAKIALKAVNGRPGSLAGAPEGPGGFGTPGVRLLNDDAAVAGGLGFDGTHKIGGYAVAIKPGTVQADGVDVDSIRSSTNGAGWGPSPSGILGKNLWDNLMNSWSKKGTTLPIAFETLSGKLAVQAYINKTSELDLSKPVALDGLTTIELVYL